MPMPTLTRRPQPTKFPPVAFTVPALAGTTRRLPEESFS